MIKQCSFCDKDLNKKNATSKKASICIDCLELFCKTLKDPLNETITNKIADIDTRQRKIIDIQNEIINLKAKLLKDYSDWTETDPRLVFYTCIVNILGIVNILEEGEKYLLSEKLNNYDENGLSLVFNAITSYVKMYTFNSFFIEIESNLRYYLRMIDPDACNNATGNFKNIYECFFNRINLEKDYISYLDLIRTVRNTMHNNWFYRDKNNKDYEVEYKGRKYLFEINKRIDFVDWDFIFYCIFEAKEMFLKIMETSPMKAAKFI